LLVKLGLNRFLNFWAHLSVLRGKNKHTVLANFIKRPSINYFFTFLFHFFFNLFFSHTRVDPGDSTRRHRYMASPPSSTSGALTGSRRARPSPAFTRTGGARGRPTATAPALAAGRRASPWPELVAE
jgi:hypothetical protein